MKKKGLSNVFVVVIFFLLALIAVIIFWNILSPEIREQGEVGEARYQLLTERLDITRVNGVSPNSQTFNLTIQRGPTQQFLANVTIEEGGAADIVFIIDSTGSMNETIYATRDNINNFTNKLEEEEIDYRLALIEFKDYPFAGNTGIPPNTNNTCGRYSDFPNKTHSFPTGVFTTDRNEYIAGLNSVVSGIQAGDGGDPAESHLRAVESGRLYLNFLPNAKKFFILISDMYPHARDCYDATWHGGQISTYCSVDLDGPQFIEEVTDELVDDRITVYYISSQAGACRGTTFSDPTDDIMITNMTGRTGGQFFEISDASQINGIIEVLSDQIINQYAPNAMVDRLLIVVYNAIDTQAFTYYDIPQNPFETHLYTIPPPGDSTVLLSNINRIELYAVIVTPSGQEIVSEPLDVWEF